MLPQARLVEPPWGDREWLERQGARDEGLFARWPLLAPTLLEWQGEVLAWQRTGGSPAMRGVLGHVGQPQRIHEQPRQLIDSVVEITVEQTLHEPHLGEPVGHCPEAVGGDDRIESSVGEPVTLQATDGVRDLRRVDAMPLVARMRVELLVEA